MNSEKVLPMFSDKKGRLLQIEKLMNDKYVVLFTKSFEFISLDSDKETSSTFAVESFPQSTNIKFELLQKIILDNSTKIQCQFFLLRSGRISQYALLTEIEDSKHRYFFHNTRDLYLTDTPIHAFSLLTSSHMIFTTSTHIQAACFSLASNLNANTFAAVDMPSSARVLMAASHSVFTMHGDAVYKHRILKDWHVAIEGMKQGRVADGLELMTTWICGHESRLIPLRQADGECMTDDKKARLVQKAIDEVAKYATGGDGWIDDAGSVACKMIELLYSTGCLEMKFMEVLKIYTDIDAIKVLYFEIFDAVKKSTILSLADMILVSTVEYLVKNTDCEHEINSIDTVLLNLDLSHNNIDSISSLFYEKSLYASFLKILLSKQPPDYFTGLSLLTGRMMRSNLGKESKECLLVMSILYSAYRIQYTNDKFNSFEDLNPTPTLDRWLLSSEIFECLFRAMPIESAHLYLKIYGQSTLSIRNQIETQLSKISSTPNLNPTPTPTQGDLQSTHAYFSLLSHLHHGQPASRKQAIHHLQSISATHLVSSLQFDGICTHTLEMHMHAWNYAQLADILCMCERRGAVLAGDLGRVKMGKRVVVPREGVGIVEVCRLVEVVRRSCGEEEMEGLLESVVVGFDKLVKEGASDEEVKERVGILIEQVFNGRQSILIEDNSKIGGGLMIEIMEQLYGMFRSDKQFTKKLFTLYCQYEKENALKYCKLHLLPLDDCIEIARVNECKEAEIYLLMRNGQFEKCIQKLALYCKTNGVSEEDQTVIHHSSHSDFVSAMLCSLINEKTLKNQELILLQVATSFIPLFKSLPNYLENLLFPSILDFNNALIQQYLMSACPEAFLYWSRVHSTMYESTAHIISHDYRQFHISRHRKIRQGHRHDSCHELNDIDDMTLDCHIDHGVSAGDRLMIADMIVHDIDHVIDRLYY